MEYVYNHDIDRKIDRIAQRQCGAFNLAQLRDAGGDSDTARHRIGLGRWIQIAPAVFAVVSFPGTFERQCWASVLGEPDAAIGALAAAHLFGAPDFRPGRPEIVVAPGRNARSEIAKIHRYAGAAVTTLRRLPITTPAQTIFDIAGRVSIDRLEGATDHLLLKGDMTVADLDERLTTYLDSRRPGLPILRLVIAARRAGGYAVPISELERLGDRILRRLSGSPSIVPEASFPWLLGGAGRVDRYLCEEGIIIEFDGRLWHARVQAFDEDRWRDNQAAAAGLVVLRFTWTHVKLRPREVMAIIERTRRARRARPAA